MKKATLCYIWRAADRAGAADATGKIGTAGEADRAGEIGTAGAAGAAGKIGAANPTDPADATGAADREYLMLYRNKKPDDPNEGKWIGVGGKFEPGETPDACMLREVREETGLALQSYQFCGVIHFISDTWEDEDMYLYRAEATGGDAFAETPVCSEGELRWIPEAELMDLPMWEGDRLFLKPLLEGADEISMTLRYEGEKLLQP